MGTREGEEVEEVVIVVVEVEITEEVAAVDLGGEDMEEAAMAEIITMRMTDITTDRVTETGAEVCMTPWSASRGRTTRRTRT